MLYALFFSAAANAGFFGDLCQRYLIDPLVADDPYQYEEADPSWLSRRLDALEIKRRWGRLPEREAAELVHIRDEIRNRELRAAVSSE